MFFFYRLTSTLCAWGRLPIRKARANRLVVLRSAHLSSSTICEPTILLTQNLNNDYVNYLGYNNVALLVGLDRLLLP